MKNNYKLVSDEIIDTTTGEIISPKNTKGIRAVIIEEGSYIRTPNQIKYLKEQELRYHDNTPYVWANFEYCKPYFPQIHDANIPRLIFFSTFCNSSGYVMCKQAIKNMLKLNYNQVKDFRDNSSDIISIVDDKAYISETAFYIGEMRNINKHYTRLFLDSNRQLYLSCNVSQHKQLSYIYRMMPYVNRQTNLLSYNQQEQDVERIEYMTVKEFCGIVGYDTTHSSRFSDNLSQFRIFGELAVGFFDNLSELNPKGKYAVVNPILYFGGIRETKAYNNIRNLFKEEKQHNNNQK